MSVYQDDIPEGMTAQAGPYDAVLDGIREADLGSRQEFIIRYVVVTASGLALYYATGTSVMLWWLCAYLFVNASYSAILYHTRGPIYRPVFLGFIAGNIFSSCIFLSMPLYLFTFTEQPALRALAIAGMAGHAMFNLSRHTSRTPLIYWDIICILGYCIFTSGFEILNSVSLSEQIVLAVAAIAVGGYYTSAQLGTIAAHERLEEARRSAVHDQKIRAVGRLTGGVAHDFNNLLTVVKGNLELYPEMASDDEKSEVIAEAHKAATRAGDVITQLLSFSRQSRLAPVQLNLQDWAREFETLSFRLLPETISAKMIVQPDVDTVFVDAGQLSAALMNLVINARDAIGGAPGTITIEIQNITGKLPTVAGPLPHNSYVCFCVSDSGTGVDPKTLSRLTEPFYTTKPTGQGSGLGLSMARGFAEQSGGGLSVDSRLGQGTRVSLCINPNPDTHAKG